MGEETYDKGERGQEARTRPRHHALNEVRMSNSGLSLFVLLLGGLVAALCRVANQLEPSDSLGHGLVSYPKPPCDGGVVEPKLLVLKRLLGYSLVSRLLGRIQ